MRQSPLAVHRKTVRIALCCAVALAGNVNAQAADNAAAPGWTEPYVQAMDSGARQSTRGIFAATVAALIAQGVGNGIGTALSETLSGSITRWFGRAPAADSTATQQPAAADSGAPAETERPHAGLAFELHLIGADGATRAVDPSRHAFKTGDRFQIFYRPTLPGRINVFNVDPQRRESQIDSLQVAAGQLATLGPYQFVGEKGNETLRMVLAPCSSAAMAAATRKIVKVESPTVAADPAVRLGECSDSKTRGQKAKIRSIRKAPMDGLTAFALDPLSKEEIKSGAVAPREVRVALRHR
jgi:hypothetical protein